MQATRTKRSNKRRRPGHGISFAPHNPPQTGRPGAHVKRATTIDFNAQNGPTHMHRPLGMIALLLTALLVALAAPGSGTQSPVTFGYGDLDYSIIKDGVPPTCSGNGPFALTYDVASGRMTVSGAAIGCAPISSVVSGCQPMWDGTIHCELHQNGHDRVITLYDDGRFDYVWSAPDFYETMNGQLARYG